VPVPGTEFRVRNFGPFEFVEFEVFPLTVFVGRNSVGKSFLLYLLWTLEVTAPDPWLWISRARELGIYDLSRRAYEKVLRYVSPVDEVYGIAKILIEAFPHAYARALAQGLRACFGSDLHLLVKRGSHKAVIEVTSEFATLDITIEDGSVYAEWRRLDVYSLLERMLEVSIHGGPTLVLKVNGSTYKTYVRDHSDIVAKVHESVYASILVRLLGFVPGLSVSLLVDGRAGLLRILPYRTWLLGPHVRELMYTDLHFMDTLSSLSIKYASGAVELENPIVRDLFKELGAEPVLRTEIGVPRIYIRTWTGIELPLERAPSGIREVVPVLLALLDRELPALYLEEPEAHLHPRAQKHLVRLMVYAINRGLKFSILMSTHSPYVVYTLSNLIAMHKLPDEDVAKLGHDPGEKLRPEYVKLYLVTAEECTAKLKELEVTEEGIDESALTEVAEELAEERALIYEQLTAKEKNST